MEQQIRQSLQQFIVIGVSHKTCPVDVREKFHFSEEVKNKIIQEGKASGVSSIIPVSTCNRTEIYAFAENSELITYLFRKYSQASFEEFISYCYFQKGHTAIKHVFRVATGMDSQILGELEIAGQLKQAFKNSYDSDMVNTFTERLIQYVNQASKKIKTQTSLSRGAASISRAAVQYIRDHANNLGNSRVILFGVGEIGRNTCDNLLKHIQPEQLTVVNRTPERAKEFAGEYNCNYDELENLKKQVEDSEIIIVATGATKPTLTAEPFSDIHQNSPKIVLDLSVPRNVSSSVEDLAAINLITIDALQEQNESVLKIRNESIPKADEIIDKQIEEFYSWLKINYLSPVFSSFQDYLSSVKQREMHRYKDKIPEHQMDHVEELTDSIINKISRQCINYLRNNNSKHHTPAEVITSMFRLHKK
ncbi:MAG: glutamyl-tRNA reductase [Bacteroidota bacterium]